eukprot:c25841_g1_i1 orf=825-1685(-)
MFQDLGMEGGLTEDQVAFYLSEGYLVLENFSNENEFHKLMQCMGALVDQFDPQTVSIFSSKSQIEHLNNYFFDSANNISFFFEENAFNDDHKLKQPKSLSINKVGHALHDLEPEFQKFSYSPRIAALLLSLGYRRPALIQSMYIFKQPGIGGEVVPHQDDTFLHTDPPSCIGFWLALEDANKENGCLWVLPQSHKGGLARRFFRDANGVRFDRELPAYDYSKFVSLEVKAGSLVIIHGDLVHQSFENKSPKSRHAYSIHAIETDGCSWAPENWLQRKVDPKPLYAL